MQSMDVRAFEGDYMLKVDIDSFYAGHESLGVLVRTFGNGVLFEVDNVKLRTSSSTSSRLGMILTPKRELEDRTTPITMKVAGFHAERVGLNYIPNVKIMESKIMGVSQTCHVNMYFIGTKYSSKNSFFTHKQLRAITLLLNTARSNLINNLSGASGNGAFDSVDLDALLSMPFFESKTGGTQDRLMKNKKFVMTSTQAKSFCNYIDRALNKYKNADMNLERFKDLAANPVLLGHHSFPYAVEEKDLKDMFQFLQDLSKGVYFTINCAGFKHDYHSKPEFRERMSWDEELGVDENREEMRKQVVTMTHNALSDFHDKLRRNIPNAASNINYDDFLGEELPFNFYVDVGIEISPTDDSDDSFVLNAKVAREEAKSLLDWEASYNYGFDTNDMASMDSPQDDQYAETQPDLHLQRSTDSLEAMQSFEVEDIPCSLSVEDDNVRENYKEGEEQEQEEEEKVEEEEEEEAEESEENVEEEKEKVKGREGKNDWESLEEDSLVDETNPHVMPQDIQLKPYDMELIVMGQIRPMMISLEATSHSADEDDIDAQSERNSEEDSEGGDCK